MPASDPHSDRQLLGRAALVFWSLSVAVMLAVFAPKMADVQPGTASEFWEVACEVELEPPFHEWGGHVFVDDEGWFVYDLSYINDTPAFYVSGKEANAWLDKAIGAVEKLPEDDFRRPAVQSHLDSKADWKRTSRAAVFVRKVNDVRTKWYIEKHPDSFPLHVDGQQLLADRWERQNVYWAAICFEWVLFTGLAAIALRPWRRGNSPLSWATHFALLPPLILLPVYLGYSTASGIESLGPIGGVLYPWLVSFGLDESPLLGGTATASDQWLFEHLPHILEPMSTRLDYLPTLSWMGIPSLIHSVLAGLLYGGLVGLARWACLSRRAERIAPNPS